MPIGRWFREGKFSFGPVAGLNHAFAERKLQEHLAGKVDERLFLWCYWLLEKWGAKGDQKLDLRHTPPPFQVRGALCEPVVRSFTRCTTG